MGALATWLIVAQLSAGGIVIEPITEAACRRVGEALLGGAIVTVAPRGGGTPVRVQAILCVPPDDGRSDT